MYNRDMKSLIIDELNIKKIRHRMNYSQRELARMSLVSFPQIQRIENNIEHTTVKTFKKLLSVFEKDIKIVSKEPKWDNLYSCGIPLTTTHSPKSKINFLKSILTAHDFLAENFYNPHFERHKDAYKAFLLALYTHYPTKFKNIELLLGMNLKKTWSLDKYEGKHIKLRNISLALLSQRFKNGQ